MLVVLTVYPIITVLSIVAGPLLNELPLYGRFAITVPTMVGLMIWIVVPLLHRFFGSWLTKDSPQNS